MADINNLKYVLNSHSDLDEETEVLFESKYFDDKSFVKSIGTKKGNFNVLSSNIESLHSKHKRLVTYLDDLKIQGVTVHALCFQECWLDKLGSDNASVAYPLDGYKLISKPSSASAKGGLVVYLVDGLEGKIMNINGTNDKIWEKMFLEVTGFANGSKLTLGNVYR